MVAGMLIAVCQILRRLGLANITITLGNESKTKESFFLGVKCKTHLADFSKSL